MIPGLRRKPLQWSIGVYEGDAPTRLEPSKGARNPVLTATDVSDAPAVFVAHPSVVRENGEWYMFFEVFRRDTRRGVVALATSTDGVRWSYSRQVLVEPFHLTNPYVFHWDGEYWMIPDTSAAAEVRLYRAIYFPVQWAYAGRLLEGVLIDPSITRRDGRWWLFACAAPSEADTLRLFFAEDLSGAWREHPSSPVRSADPNHSRPAGRLLELDGRLVRFAQDWGTVYARQVWAFEITDLTPESYLERPASTRPVLSPGRQAWNRTGMHHVDVHLLPSGRWRAFVDGRGEERTLKLPSVRAGVSHQLRRIVGHCRARSSTGLDAGPPAWPGSRL